MAIINGRGRVGIRRPSAAATPSIVLDGLKLYLDAGKTASYAGTGTLWTDLSGNGNTGTLTNGPVYNSSNGGSIAFDGTDDHIRLLTLNPYLNNVNKFTYETWIKVNNPASSTLQTVFSFGQSDLYNYDILIAITQNILVLQINNGADGSAVSSYSGATWNNISLVYDGLQTGNINRLKVYINGVLVVLNFSTYTVPSSTANGGYTNAGIGAYSTGNYYSNRFTGNISVSKLYNRVLSAAEVLQNYNALKSRFLPMTYSIVADGLKLHLDAGNLDSYYGAGTTWKDLSGNSINAALTNGPVYSSANSGSIVFDGVNDYIDLGTNLRFNNTDITYDFWCKVVDNPGVYRDLIVQSDPAQSTLAGLLKARSGFFNGSVYLAFMGNTLVSTLTGDQLLSAGIINYTGVIKLESGVYKMYLYRNGILDNQRATAITSYNMNTWTNFQTRIGSGTSMYMEPWKGNIYAAKVYNRALSAAEVSQNYNALLSRFYPIVSDSDAQAFVVAAGLTSSTQANAINTLVTSMKTAGIWTKMKAVYPFVGGSAASHKFNLKDPRDLDTAYRLTFTAGWVHSSTGAKPNGTSDYADTKIPGVNTNQNSTHISTYLRTDINGLFCDLGVDDNNGCTSIWSRNNNLIYNQINNLLGNYITVSNVNSTGFYHSNRTSPNSLTSWKNGVKLITGTNSSSSPSSKNILISALNDITGANYYSPRQQAFASIGDGLSDTEASNLYTAVQAYQTALGRQV